MDIVDIVGTVGIVDIVDTVDTLDTVHTVDKGKAVGGRRSVGYVRLIRLYYPTIGLIGSY